MRDHRSIAKARACALIEQINPDPPVGRSSAQNSAQTRANKRLSRFAGSQGVLTREEGVLITCLACIVERASRATPSHSRRATDQRRTRAEFSPMPAVKTRRIPVPPIASDKPRKTAGGAKSHTARCGFTRWAIITVLQHFDIVAQARDAQEGPTVCRACVSIGQGVHAFCLLRYRRHRIKRAQRRAHHQASREP